MGWNMEGGLNQIRRTNIVNKTALNLFYKYMPVVLHEDKAGNLWVGTRGGGLFKIVSDDKIERYTVQNGLSGNRITTIHEGTKGEVLISSSYGPGEGGIDVLKKGTFRRYRIPRRLSGYEVSAIVDGRDGKRWFATYENGLFLEENGVTRG